MKRLLVKAELVSLSKVLDFVRENAESAGFEQNSTSELLIACEEIVVNIVSYGYEPGKKGEIEIIFRYSTEESAVELTICDWGNPFDPLTVPPPDITKPIEEREPGGLGIHFVKSLMDKVSYRRERSSNILTLIKKNSAAAGEKTLL